MDSLCISYPKSGRTWLRVMLRELDAPIAFTHLDTGHNSRSWGKPARKINTPRANVDRIIFLYRDPRDTVVSYFYETTIRQKPDLSRAILYRLQRRSAPQTMPALVRSHRFGIEKIIVFNLLCAEHLKAHPVAYEDLRKDTVEQLSTILNHIGVIRPMEQISEVVENNSFAKMHRREASGSYGKPELEARDRGNPNSFKVRRGKVGGWRDELDPATQEFAHRMLDKYRYFERMRELASS